MTASGKAFTKPWRVTWYVRDPVTGKPTGGGRRAFALEASARKLEADKRAEGWSVECWAEQTLPGT